jgi:hypothetical protein
LDERAEAANIDRQRLVPADAYEWFYECRRPLPSSHVWLCRYVDPERWPFVAHQWAMTFVPEHGPPPAPGDPLNGFGVAFAIGPLAFWLFAADVPGGPLTTAGSDDAHLLIWPLTGADVRWPPLRALASDAELRELSQRVPAGVIRREFGDDD